MRHTNTGEGKKEHAPEEKGKRGSKAKFQTERGEERGGGFPAVPAVPDTKNGHEQTRAGTGGYGRTRAGT